MGLLDRLDALDRRVGLGGPSPRAWRDRRPPWAVLLGSLLFLYELVGLIQEAIGHRDGIIVLAFLPLFIAAFALAVGVASAPVRWAPRVVVAIELLVAVRVVYRAMNDPLRLVGLAYIGAVIALLTIPPSSRAFYGGRWYRHS